MVRFIDSRPVHRWRAQGDAVYIEAPTGTEACQKYRRQMQRAQIGIVTERADVPSIGGAVPDSIGDAIAQLDVALRRAAAAESALQTATNVIALLVRDAGGRVVVTHADLVEDAPPLTRTDAPEYGGVLLTVPMPEKKPKPQKPVPLIHQLRRKVADMVAEMRVRGYDVKAPIGDYVELRVTPIWPDGQTYVFTPSGPDRVYLHIDPLPHSTDQVFDTLEDAIAAIPTDDPPVGLLRSQVVGG